MIDDDNIVWISTTIIIIAAVVATGYYAKIRENSATI